jgi:hypothetical protein
VLYLIFTITVVVFANLRPTKSLAVSSQKIEKLQSELHFLGQSDAEEARRNKHVVFVEDEQVWLMFLTWV